MAPELRAKKRKVAPTAAPKPVKKVKSDTNGTTKVEAPTVRKTTKASRPKAADFLEELPISEEPAPEPTNAPELETVAEEEAESEPEGEDDQTAALLKGFESSEDEAEVDDEGLTLDKLPELPEGAQMRTKTKALKDKGAKSPGVVYIGRVPHGFYEHQMRAYFSQFGDITRLRLSRNKKTGRSKHYAFIEFADSSDAQIVADTMDKYLMFGHILQVRVIPTEQVHEDLFKGANKRFKPTPHNKMEARRLRLGMERGEWDRRLENEKKRRNKKLAKLKEIGYEFEAPELKSVDSVPVQPALPAVDEVKAIEAGEEDTSKPEARKDDDESKKAEEQPADGVTETVNVDKPSKAKTVKKQKSVSTTAVAKKSSKKEGVRRSKTAKA